MVVKKMQIPGTNLELTSKVDRVYIAHEGVIKKVKYTGRSFKDVMEEVQRFAYLRGFNVPITILKFILKRIGLPEVDRIPGEDQLTKEDLLELSRALTALDSLKDEFLSPFRTTVVPDEIKKGLIAESLGMEDLTPEIHVKEKQTIWDLPLSEEVTELIYSFHAENIPVSTPTPRTQSESEPASSSVKFIWDDADAVEQIANLNPDEQAPAELDSELLELKVLFLGERGVGISSILFECNLKSANEIAAQSSSEIQTSAHNNTVKFDDKNVRLDAWTFPQGLETKKPKTEFYTGSGIVVLVYSVADRWSYDSLDFWVREVSNTFLIPPPIIVVGNKTDLRDHPVFDDEDELDTPVTTEEAQEFCDQIGKRIGGNGQSHPVFFMETSSVTGQGISNLLEKIIEFWLTNERPSMPAVEEHVPLP
ncbi:MAG: Rab family GTPase [Candidatus Odinarchaeota archaeon]